MSQQKIFAVDDDEKVLKLIELLLRERGYQVMTANKGKGSVEKIKEFSPDLILLDIMLPDVYGSDLAASIKEDPVFKNVPIVFLTGLRSDATDEEDMTKVKVGENYYTAIAKPFDAEELLNEVRIALKMDSLDI